MPSYKFPGLPRVYRRGERPFGTGSRSGCPGSTPEKTRSTFPVNIIIVARPGPGIAPGLVLGLRHRALESAAAKPRGALPPKGKPHLRGRASHAVVQTATRNPHRTRSPRSTAAPRAFRGPCSRHSVNVGLRCVDHRSRRRDSGGYSRGRWTVTAPAESTPANRTARRLCGRRPR